MATAKQKLAILNTPGANQVLLDALKIYITEVKGYVLGPDIAEITEQISRQLVGVYSRSLKKTDLLYQTDLETAIKEAKYDKINK